MYKTSDTALLTALPADALVEIEKADGKTAHVKGSAISAGKTTDFYASPVPFFSGGSVFISAGTAIDKSTSLPIIMPAALVKDTFNRFAVGEGNGCLGSTLAAVTSTAIAGVFLIEDPIAGLQDVIISTSWSVTDRPAAYTSFALISLAMVGDFEEVFSANFEHIGDTVVFGKGFQLFNLPQRVIDGTNGPSGAAIIDMDTEINFPPGAVNTQIGLKVAMSFPATTDRASLYAAGETVNAGGMALGAVVEMQPHSVTTYSYSSVVFNTHVNAFDMHFAASSVSSNQSGINIVIDTEVLSIQMTPAVG